MQYLICYILLVTTVSANGQKKLLPVTESVISGIQLPKGSKSDLRFLSIASARALFDMEFKNSGLKINSTEVLSLPVSSLPAMNEEDLNTVLQQAGWTLIPISTNNKFKRAQKDGKTLLTYFSAEPKEINLYFAECVALQVPAGSDNNNQGQNQPVYTTDSASNSPFLTPPDNLNDQQNPQQLSYPSEYAFNTTNFDDGWTSVIKDDWVEVTKANLTVRLHYPKEGTIFSADPDPLTRAAWDILVAPRYRDLKNFKTTYISTYDRPYIGHGYATENISGAELYVVLFRQGNTGWIEMTAPDKNSFKQYFKIDPDDIRWDTESGLMQPLAAMSNYNKFAVAQTDFTGNWTDHFASNTYYTNIYTGNSAGMSTYTSSQTFEFTGNRYKWQLVAANSYGGQSAFAQAKGNGIFKVLNNWQVNFSDLEGKPKTFNAYFSAVKGSRILWMIDAQYPGSGIYTGFKKK